MSRDGEWIGDWLDEPGAETAERASAASDAVPERIETLAAVPNPGAVYLGALGRAGRAIVTTSSLTTSLPDVALRADLTLDRERLDRVLAGELPFDERTMVDDDPAPAAEPEPVGASA